MNVEKGHQFVELHVVCCLGGMSWEGCERGGVGADDAREERIVRNGVLKYDHARSQKKKKKKHLVWATRSVGYLCFFLPIIDSPSSGTKFHNFSLRNRRGPSLVSAHIR